MTRTLSGAAAIAGIGATEFSRPGRSELRLAAEAVTAAVADAGLAPPTSTAWSASRWTPTPRSRSPGRPGSAT